MRDATARDFDAERAWGREAEIKVGAWLKTRGWLILPTYDYSGADDSKAPKLEAADRARSLVVPDLMAARAGSSPAWFEVKRKTETTFYRKNGQRQTGLSPRLLGHYHITKNVTRMNVWLVFVHEEEREIRYFEIDSLAPDHTAPIKGKLTTFFDYDAMAILPASYAAVMR